MKRILITNPAIRFSVQECCKHQIPKFNKLLSFTYSSAADFVFNEFVKYNAMNGFLFSFDFIKQKDLFGGYMICFCSKMKSIKETGENSKVS